MINESYNDPVFDALDKHAEEKRLNEIPDDPQMWLMNWVILGIGFIGGFISACVIAFVMFGNQLMHK